ncbi:MAG TPA: hypothetical protein ENI60_05495 [Candidatus Fraserbacteria bacterium]|nr:hypothetical protein [Candidatus Fraserbacteria bacterium]
MTVKEKTSAAQLSLTEHALLNETVEWSGRLLTAYALLLEAERTGDEASFDQAWGDLTTALFLLRDKTEQAQELLEKD